MLFPNLVTYLLFLLPFVFGKTGYIHESCSTLPDWETYWDEAKSFAKEAYERAQSDTDYDFRVIITSICYKRPLADMQTVSFPPSQGGVSNVCGERLSS